MESLHSPVIIKGNLNKQFKFPHNGNTRPNFITGQFYQVFKESIIPVLHKLFLRIKNDEPFNIRFLKQIFILEQFQVHSKTGEIRHLPHPSSLPSHPHSFPHYQHPGPEFPTTFYKASMTQILILEIEKLHTNLIQK